MTIGEKVKALRLSENLKQTEVADALNLSVRAYQSIEAGDRGLSVQSLIAIAEYFDVSTDFLLGVGKTATFEEIHNNLDFIAHKIFRDLSKDEEDEVRLRQIFSAYSEIRRIVFIYDICSDIQIRDGKALIDFYL